MLANPSGEIAEIGVLIMKLIVAGDDQNRIRMTVRAGFLNMMTKGYFGVLTTGGAGVATYLASRPDEAELALRFYRTFGYVPVYIHKVGTEDGLVEAEEGANG